VTVTGRIFNIQRFSVHDGPGIRTTVFLKGCNLACEWCHNPESRKASQEIQFFQQKCVLCMACMEASPRAHYIGSEGQHVFDREALANGGLDTASDGVDECLYDALVYVARFAQVAEVVGTAMKDADYYRNSGGGVTFSGGEPLLQKEFVRAVAAELKSQGIHTALDTAAHVEWADLEYALPVIDLVLLDIKVMDAEVHKRYTGVTNERILSNARRLAASNIDMIVRIPVIPTVNATERNMVETAELIEDWPRLKYVELLPYHDLGVDKLASLGYAGEPVVFETPSPQTMRELARPFEARGLRVKLNA
jgi:pyruvate formate lyase activating enzyme